VEGTLLVNSPADFTAPNGSANDTISAANANIVRFTGDRPETQYATAPGQWTGIVLDASSRGNVIRYAQIQNATFGLMLYNPKNLSPMPDVSIENSVIRYISGSNVGFAGAASSSGLPGAGVLSLSGKVQLTNTLISDCYEYALLGYGGGDYTLNYCTIANFPATSAVRSTPSLRFTNVSALNDKVKNTTPPLSVKLYNSIVWGGIEDELLLENYDDYKATVDVRYTLLRTKLYAAATDAAGKPGLGQASYNNLISNDPYYPKFLKVYTGGRDDYRLGDKSPALGHATQQVAPFIARDLLNLPRNPNQPDLGAYQATK
jgi:hypothetical protein